MKRPHLTIQEKIERVLSRLPSDGPLNARAAELLERHRRCELQAVRAAGPGSLLAEREQLVDKYRTALLAELGDLAAEADLARVREGGATC